MSILLGKLNEKVKGEKVTVAKLMWSYCFGTLGLSPPGDPLKHCAECDLDLSLWGVRSLGVNTTFIIQCVRVASLTCSWVFNTWCCLLPQFNSVTQSCPTLCDPMECSTPGFPVHHQLLELTQTHVLRVSDAIQPSHPLLSPSPPTCNHSQHQGLFQWVSSSHQVANVLELQLQHHSFQRLFRTDFL